MTVTTAQATTLLENVLFEPASLAEAAAPHWVAASQYNAAESTIQGMAEVMANSAEAGIAQQVVRYYEGALGREPSSNEIAYYVGIAEAGLSPMQIAQGTSAVSGATWNQIAGYFAASPEFNFATSGSGVIAGLYQNILNRAPTTDEASFYQKQLSAGTSVATLLQYFVNSPEYQGKMNAGIVANLAATGEIALTGASSEVLPSGTSASAISLGNAATITYGGTTMASGAITVSGAASGLTDGHSTFSGGGLSSAWWNSAFSLSPINQATIFSGGGASQTTITELIGVHTLGNAGSTPGALPHLI